MMTPLVQKYTWRESWVFPYESLWSMVNKFGKLNWVSGYEIQNLFRLKNEPKNRYAEYDGFSLWNFHAASGFDVEKIGQALNLTKKQIREGITTSLIPKRELPWLFEAKRLRYCPRCISVGYHSFFHQFKDVKVCPIHDIELVERCPCCKGVFPYELQRNKHFYRCPSCTKTLLSLNINDVPESEQFFEIMNSKGKLDEIFEWFFSLGKVFLYPMTDRKYYEKANEIMNYWGEIIQKKTPECFKILRRSGARHMSTVLTTDFSKNVIRLNTAASDNKYFNQRELRYIYKSIRRYILKTLETNHINCHNKVRVPWKLNHGCSLREAFKAWSSHWERKTKDKEVLWINTVLNTDLGIPALNKKVAERIFALECFWTFEDIMAHYDDEYDCQWSPEYRTYKKYPFWSLERDKERLVFHSWTEKSVLRNLIKGNCPACIRTPNTSEEARVA